jgi:hypothetical protein
VARGDFLADSATQLLTDPADSYPQTAAGTDVEYSRDHWLVRGEIVWSRWVVPFATPRIDTNVEALGSWIEGRYRLTPRIFVSGRADRLAFSRFELGPGLAPTWDAPVRRVEVDAGYYIQRNLVARLAVQNNHRDGGRVRQRTYFSGQLAFWF